MALIISAAAHLLSGQRLGGYRPQSINSKLPESAIKVRIVEQKPKKKEEAKKPEEPPPPDSERMPKLLEMPQQKTERPDESSYAGVVDHKTKKETRISEKAKRERAKDAGQKGTPDARPGVKQDKLVEAPPLEPKKVDPTKAKKDPTKEQGPEQKAKTGMQIGSTGKVSVDATAKKARNPYEALLPSGVSDLPGQVDAGYQDYVDDKVEEGDRIDINTTEYRFIGYFTNMRKAIELVWNYPLEAARKGLQGEVGLEFAIAKDGRATRIKVIKSSGYEVLDRAIVDAIKLASPFAPLPDTFQKKHMLVSGSFRYVLSYGSH